jgi:hypothetical protein
MPHNDPDPTDPYELVGVMLPSGPEAMRDMAYVFAEEFARLGHNREQILWMFRQPFYAGAHSAYQNLGAEAVTKIVDECVAVWGRVRVVEKIVMDDETCDMRPLPSSENTHQGSRHSERSEESGVAVSAGCGSEIPSTSSGQALRFAQDDIFHCLRSRAAHEHSPLMTHDPRLVTNKED